MSEMFPDLKMLVTHLPVNSCILEGEAIAYDTDTGEFLPFQETVKRKRKHGVDKAAEEFPLKLFIFDILFLDGVSELDKTQEERREVLLALFEKVPTALQDRVLPIEQRVVSTAKELEEYFYMNVTRGLEGLVVKRTDAPYTPGKRNFNWIKLKRQETGELDDTVDCVIVGYYFGQGKRAGFGIGALLVAIYDPEQDVFQTVAKIGTGLSDVEWQAMKADCDQRRAAHQPHNVQCASQLKPDVWVNPELVCVVRADEITYSPLHKAGARDGGPGLALRFPRIMGMRPDKAATEATTAQELRSLQDAQRKKRQAG
jgi:DNA ligase-1